MDVLYIGDIPQDYHYAVFGNNYIDLYNTTDLSIDGDLIDGDGYYKITCLDCGNRYNSLDDDYDCLAWE